MPSELERKVRAPFAADHGFNYFTDAFRATLAWANNFVLRQKDSSGNAHDLIGVVGNDVMIGGSKRTLRTIPVPVRMVAPATQVVFVVPSAMNGARLVGVTERHITAESTTTDLTGQLVMDRRDATTPGAGTDLLTAGMALTGAADTNVSGTLITNEKWTKLETGDRITWELSGSVNELANVVLTLYFDFAGKGFPVVCHAPTNGDAVDRAIFVANAPRIVSSIVAAWSTVGSEASLNVQLTKDTGTDVPGAGTNLLTDDSNAGIDIGSGSSANTPTTGTLITTAATLRLAAGDRLALDFAGTTTALAGFIAVVWVTADDDTVDVTYLEEGAAAQVDSCFVILDRPFIVDDARWVHSAATSDATSNAELNHVLNAVAVASGTNLLTNDSNAGFQIDGTANTVEVAAFGAKGLLQGRAGDALGLDFTGTGVTALAGAVCTVSLRPR
jgi:hypothetical protein